jgi:hypothetical protein
MPISQTPPTPKLPTRNLSIQLRLTIAIALTIALPAVGSPSAHRSAHNTVRVRAPHARAAGRTMEGVDKKPFTIRALPFPDPRGTRINPVEPNFEPKIGSLQQHPVSAAAATVTIAATRRLRQPGRSQ